MRFLLIKFDQDVSLSVWVGHPHSSLVFQGFLKIIFLSSSFLSSHRKKTVPYHRATPGLLCNSTKKPPAYSHLGMKHHTVLRWFSKPLCLRGPGMTPEPFLSLWIGEKMCVYVCAVLRKEKKKKECMNEWVVLGNYPGNPVWMEYSSERSVTVTK